MGEVIAGTSGELVSNSSNLVKEVQNSNNVNSNVNNNVANHATKQESDSENTSIKPKRRVRAVGPKAKSEAHLNTHSESNNGNNNSAGGAAPTTGPWDSTLDQW